MGEANILVRTGGSRESGWASVIRSAALVEHLRQVWPTARVTVFAAGDHQVHDWLWTRVRDLVALRLGVELSDEMAQRAMRGRADLVILDLPETPDDARCAAWMADADQMVVRSPLDQRAPDGRVIAGWHWTGDADAEGPVPLMGAARALVAPNCRKLGLVRRTPTDPARDLLIRLDGATREDELLVASGLASIVAGFGSVRFLTSPGLGGRHRSALSEACPGLEVVSGRGRLMELAAQSDIAITMGADLRHALAATGLPQMLISRDAEDTAAARAFATAGAARDLGPIDTIAASALAHAVLSFAEDVPALEAVSKAARSHVDGLGFERLLRETLVDYPATATEAAAHLHRVEAPEVEGETVGASEKGLDDRVVTEIDDLGSS